MKDRFVRLLTALVEAIGSGRTGEAPPGRASPRSAPALLAEGVAPAMSPVDAPASHAGRGGAPRRRGRTRPRRGPSAPYSKFRVGAALLCDGGRDRHGLQRRVRVLRPDRLRREDRRLQGAFRRRAAASGPSRSRPTRTRRRRRAAPAGRSCGTSAATSRSSCRRGGAVRSSAASRSSFRTHSNSEVPQMRRFHFRPLAAALLAVCRPSGRRPGPEDRVTPAPAATPAPVVKGALRPDHRGRSGPDGGPGVPDPRRDRDRHQGRRPRRDVDAGRDRRRSGRRRSGSSGRARS